ncbi:uncharacterized protein NDAI_0A01930 [Naumovozyma dairenensis CBS 421]|uniref:Vps72/YL1 C-terminal domain-containing protein n=1 Tax=Naumovozyma dairenensis (strain ATCC 10597 / BCRC 20456 / CBS 421 / NBRC 0211 / NRRL Y-12639) TaxID=1071378 RepID=G0W3G3_NAUDC|nr:hypothetical protein NDAI_0A01930 [Naumovozyma dairenensis CBS 421]CCD22351.1 hypothetical protein NDAI_0A01930 [Naumovozyma dairenensis CBS 421]
MLAVKTGNMTTANMILKSIPLQECSISYFKNNYQKFSNRHFVGFVKNALGMEPPPSPNEPAFENRFHPWDQSPSPDLRERAARIRALAKCPVTGKEINYTCPISGIPTHHSKEAWENDTNYHQNKIYDILKKVNVFEHDLRSGRSFPEFEFPQSQDHDCAVSMNNWDMFFYTRQFVSMDSEFQLATVTKMLSYPITIASILHKYCPYALEPNGPITLEGLKSIAALKYSLRHNEFETTKERPMRIFILGARAESQLPEHIWKQFSYLFPFQNFEINFIGPECSVLMNNNNMNAEETNTTTSGSMTEIRPNRIVKRIDERLNLVYHTDFFHTLHNARDFFPYDSYNDVFFTFHPGFASPENTKSWMGETMKALLDTKCAIFTTGFNKQDLLKDIDIVQETYGKEVDMLMKPTKNVFGSTKWELNDMDPQEVYQYNMYIAGFRGKRYHAVKV